MKASAPPRTPESKMIGSRPASRSAISGSTASVGTDSSIWRPPWFEIQTPSMPASSARTASSGCTMPFRMIGRLVQSRAFTRSSQVSAGVENTSRNVSTAARGSGERRLSRRPAPVSGAPLRAMEMPAATVFGVIRTFAASPSSPARARSRTSCRNTGSLVYCASPSPRVNGRYARSRSRVRQPSRCVSSVTTIASQPDASARCSSEAFSSSEADQYSWNSRAPSGAAVAVSSREKDAWLESVYGMPRDAAARATARSASAWASSITPSGASSSGVARRLPRKSVDRSRLDTSRSGRGHTCHRSKAARLAATVRSAPAPPAMYANASRLSALRAAASSAAGSTGTRGRCPLMPAR